MRFFFGFLFPFEFKLVSKGNSVTNNWSTPTGSPTEYPTSGVWNLTCYTPAPPQIGSIRCLPLCLPPPPSVSKSPTSSVQNMPPKYQKQPQPVAKTCLANIRHHCNYVQVKYVQVKGAQIFYTEREANLHWHIRWNNSGWHICANNLKHWHIFNEACPPHTAGNRVRHDLHLLEYSTFHSIFGSCLHC